MHRPLLRSVSAEPATLAVPAAYEDAVMMTTCRKAPVTCPDEGVRFGAYNARVTITNDVPAPAAEAVAR